MSTKFSTSAKLPVYRYENRQDRSRRCTRWSLSTNERSSLLLISYIVRYEKQFRVSFPYFPVRFTRPNAIVLPFFSTFLQPLQTYFLNTSTGGVKWRLSSTRSKHLLPLLRLLPLLSLLPISKSHSNAIFEWFLKRRSLKSFLPSNCPIYPFTLHRVDDSSRPSQLLLSISDLFTRNDESHVR